MFRQPKHGLMSIGDDLVNCDHQAIKQSQLTKGGQHVVGPIAKCMCTDMEFVVLSKNCFAHYWVCPHEPVDRPTSKKCKNIR